MTVRGACGGDAAHRVGVERLGVRGGVSLGGVRNASCVCNCVIVERRLSFARGGTSFGTVYAGTQVVGMRLRKERRRSLQEGWIDKRVRGQVAYRHNKKKTRKKDQFK